MKKITKYLIIPLFSLFAFFLFSNTKASAYSLDNNGNIVGDNLFNKSDVTIGYELNGNDGSISVANSYFTSNFIYVKDKLNLYISGTRTSGASFCFYDENKTFISTQKLYAETNFNGVLTVPSNAYYLRWNGQLSEIDVMVNEGTTALPYKEYEVFYSQSNYSNYGSSQYTEGYSTATNSYLEIVKNKSKELNTSEFTPLDYMCTTYTSGAVDCTDAFKGYVQDAYGHGKVVGNEEGYSEGHIDGQAVGYQQASDDGKVLGNFIPTILGGFGSLFLTIFNIDVLGFNLLSIFGIAITIGIIILILKFMRG